MTNEITTVATQSDLQEVKTMKTMDLLQQAVQAGTSPEALEKLVALQERILARNAEMAFNEAMTEFQRRAPSIVKRHEVKKNTGQLMYRFAPLEDIVAQIKDLLAELGLSFSFTTDMAPNGAVEVTCILRHRDGHKEPTRVYMPPTKGMNTNAAQDATIAVTYGRRQSLVNALGLTTADEDTDGNVEDRHAPVSAEQAAHIEELLDQSGADRARFLSYLGVEALEQLPASRAPSAIKALEAKIAAARRS